MPADAFDPDLEPEWEWNTRVTAEAARTALATGTTPHERFAIYERLISAACNERKRGKNAASGKPTVEPSTFTPAKSLYDEIERAAGDLSGFEEARTTVPPS